jgi:predicted NUDIX family phosphoesterase
MNIQMTKEELKAKYRNEKVFVVPFESVESIPNKFSEVKHNKNLWKQFDSIGSYIYRYDAEGEPAAQQIIPYVLILNNTGDKIFATKRIGGESRLLNKVSIACGGHIDEIDGIKEVLFRAAVRELFEEVDVEADEPLKIIGYVRDMNSATNDHTGVVIIAHAVNEVKVKETNILLGQWMSLQDLIDNYEKLESWSKYIVDHFVTKKSFI